MFLEDSPALRRLEKAEEILAERAKRAAEIEEHKAWLERRRQLRDTPPAGYQPPSSVSDLLACYEKGQRHFAGANLRGASLKGLCFEDTSFAGSELDGASVTNCTFNRCDFTNAQANASTLERSSFDDCPLDNLGLREAALADVRIKNSKLASIDFLDARFEDLVLEGCRDLPASFKKAIGMASVKFLSSNLASADLQGCNLTGTRFEACRLTGADLTDANLESAFLEGTDFTHAKLDHANLEAASLSRARFAGSTLKNAVGLTKVTWAEVDLSDCDLSNMDLRKVSFARVRANNADFTSSKLEQVDFSGASLRAAVFKDARLSHSIWKDAELDSADFEGADLRFASDIWFDQNNLYTARLSPKSKDAWTVLRRNYSGSRLAFHILILFAFFLPYVIRAAAWTQVNNAQSAHTSVIERLRATAEGEAAIELAALLNSGAVDAAISPCLASECKEWRVWELLLARDAAWYSQLLAWLLIVYNLARLYLTWRVGPLRDDEDRTYVTPSRSDYALLYAAHQIVQIVFYVSMASFALHGYDSLINGVVSLPA